ncbi:MAG TPA: PH domain-containing protein [Actinomycetes bacterium]|nr:PH domain-containing protein [Actinomycetes bacterium]
MGIPQRLLSDDERLVLVLRPHWKEIIPAALVLLVTAPAASFLAAITPEGGAQGWLRLAVLVLAVLVLLRWSLWPFLTWLTTTYGVTSERIITREGVIARQGHDMPLSRVNDVSFSHSAVERVLRCGTLVVESGGERGQLVLRDVPRVERVQREIYRLAEADELRRRGRGDEGAVLGDR